jgi:hypothetical protein
LPRSGARFEQFTDIAERVTHSAAQRGLGLELSADLRGGAIRSLLSCVPPGVLGLHDYDGGDAHQAQYCGQRDPQHHRRAQVHGRLLATDARQCNDLNAELDLTKGVISIYQPQLGQFSRVSRANFR